MGWKAKAWAKIDAAKVTMATKVPRATKVPIAIKVTMTSKVTVAEGIIFLITIRSIWNRKFT